MRIPSPRRAFAQLAASGVLASFAATASGSAPSTADVFNVELVVFRYGGTLSSAENWDVTPLPGATTTTGTTGTTGLAAQAAPADAGSQPDSIKALNPGQFQLAGTEAVLGRDADYLPLAHFGFRLVAGGRDAGTPVRIESMVDAASGLTGTVTLERGRFLHLAVDLTYTTSNPPPALLPPIYTARDRRISDASGSAHAPVRAALFRSSGVRRRRDHHTGHGAWRQRLRTSGQLAS